MAYETVLENEWATVLYEPSAKYIYHTFHKGISGEVFKSTMNTGLEALAKHGVTKWLSDDRKNDRFTPADVEFAITDWGPRAAQAGWKYWALIVPESLAGRSGMSEIVESFHRLGVRMLVFTHFDEALDWLVKQ